MARSGRRDLALLLVGAAVSTAGSSVTLVAVLLHLRPLGAAWVAAGLAAGLLPVILLAPVAGLLIDRLPNRQLLVIALALGAVSILGVAQFGLAPGREGLLVAGLIVSGISASVTGPTVAALLPIISGEAGATRAYGYYAAINQGGLLAGAALAGILVEGLGTRWALTVDALSFAVMALAAAGLRVQRTGAAPGDRRQDRRSRWAAQWAGFGLLRDDSLLRVTVFGLAIVVLVSIVVNVAEVFFVIEDLGVGPAGYGLLTACWPLAGIAGGWFGGRLSSDAHLVRALLCGVAAMGAAIALAGAVATVPALAIAWCIAGAANALQVVCIQALVRSRVDNAHRGRAFAALAAVLQSANVLGLAVSAGVVVLLDARLSLVVAGSVTVGVAALMWAASRAARTPAAHSQEHSVHPTPEADAEEAVENRGHQRHRS